MNKLKEHLKNWLGGVIAILIILFAFYMIFNKIDCATGYSDFEYVCISNNGTMSYYDCIDIHWNCTNLKRGSYCEIENENGTFDIKFIPNITDAI